jgi:hypothetical protein
MEILAVWQILLLVAYALLVLPVAAVVGAAIRWGGNPAPDRMACRSCGYAMVVLERECPRCRAAVT